MKKTQRETNPYPHSDSNKRYRTYEYYLRQTFGGRCVKIPIDAGFTCPNIDGRCGYGGCIYCSGRGSGDFAGTPEKSISEQFREGIELLSGKWDTSRKIAYFQAHTNTYAPTKLLREKFEAALAEEGVVGLNIATRADCLEDETVEYLAELSERTVLTVELGLQTANDATAELINRGHSFEDFTKGYKKLRRASEKIGICVHIIFGLPGETRETMLETVKKVAGLKPEQVKIHLLYVIKGTKLARMYESGEYTPMSEEEYISVVCDALELLPTDTVIGRLTGDGAEDTLIAPLWSRRKTAVLNGIDKEMYRRGTYQGKNATKEVE